MTAFLSRVLDAGAPVPWATATWSASVPAGTSLALSVRTGNTPTPDGSWTTFTPLANPGAAVGQTASDLSRTATEMVRFYVAEGLVFAQQLEPLLGREEHPCGVGVRGSAVD